MVAAFSFLIALASFAAPNVEIYQYSNAVENSSLYSVTISGNDVGVIPSEQAHIAQFGSDGEVLVNIEYKGLGELQYADIRPMDKAYEYELSGNTLKMKLKTYDRVSVEINGNKEQPLFIFVNPLEQERANELKEKKNILFFKAGNIYSLKRLTLENYDGLYIEGGAVVKAVIIGEELSGLKIEGCGILDCRMEGGNAVKFSGCSKLSMENICVLNSGMTACLFINCTDLSLKNVKAVNIKTKSLSNEKAAIDFAGCKKVSAEKIFSYGQSHAISLHNKYAEFCFPTEDVSIEDCVAWNVQTANTININGTDDLPLNKISIKDFYAIHSAGTAKPYYRAVISIRQSGTKKVSNIDFFNVVSEDPGEYLFNLSGWITDVTFNKFNAYSKAPFGSLLKGNDFDHRVENVIFRDFTIGKKPVSTLKQAGVKSPSMGLNILFKK